MKNRIVWSPRFAVVVTTMFFCCSANALEASAIFETNKGSVGAVKAGTSRGSGVVVAPKMVLTNCHVVAGQREIVFRHANVDHKADLVEGSRAFDLCKLRVPSLNAKAATTRASRGLKIGERVYAIGNPRGLELTLSDGLISGLREIENETQIQTSAPVSPGSSGGGLFDSSGRLIGIVTYQFTSGQNLNFAMPIGLQSRLAPLSYVESFSESQILSPERLDQIMAAFERGDVAAMKSYAETWFEQDAGSAFALSLAGMTFAALDQPEIAEQALMRALVVLPNYAPAMVELSTLASFSGDMAKAEGYLRSCAKVRSAENSFVAAYRALCRGKLGDKSALTELDALIAENPPRSWLQLVAALTAYHLKDYERALSSALRALEINQESGMAHAGLVITYVALKRPSYAVIHARQALAISADNPSFLLAAITSAIASRDFAAMKGYFAHLSEVAPKRAQAFRAKLPPSVFQ